MQHDNETLRGIVERVTFHSAETGWSVLKVRPFQQNSETATVTVHQTKVFPGSSMLFNGAWTTHAKFGRQFKAVSGLEIKPATSAALEKYLGSGLIKGVGPKIAHRIVAFFGEATLEVFENEIDQLMDVPGIAQKKLAMIKEAWLEHRQLRDIMIFLQSHEISTLFAVRIYKLYKERAIELVSADPYRLANDFYGIGFFTADKVAASLGVKGDSPNRIMAAVKHVLTAARDAGHCYLTYGQILLQTQELLGLDLQQLLAAALLEMQNQGLLMSRLLGNGEGGVEPCYYGKALFYDELTVAGKIRQLQGGIEVDAAKIEAWISRYCQRNHLALSAEQARSVAGIMGHRCSILTGGPGCGKTTTIKVLVKLLQAMNMKVLLAAPTGRAAQRMGEVIGQEARTVHRLLEWQAGKFKRNAETPLELDFLIVDECSMLDVSLAAALLAAVPASAQLLLIGDADQLPSVGAGNVLHDLIASKVVACFVLSKIFRQASHSRIVQFAHQLNRGELPPIDSPFHRPELWKGGADCLFIDSEEATAEQLHFIARVKRLPRAFFEPGGKLAASPALPAQAYEFNADQELNPYQSEWSLPKKFQHVDLAQLCRADSHLEELKTVLRSIHPWSSLHYGLTATQVIEKLYLEWVPKYYGAKREIQVLSPMTKGSLGTFSLNRLLQNSANPPDSGRRQLQFGERLFREGDRIIHRRNNYELGVFNGDIGVIRAIDPETLSMQIEFYAEGRLVTYQRDDIVELDLAYAITIHKSQGSEFEVVIIPVLSQHFKMLFRNLIYTALTRARVLAVFVGSRRAMAMAVRNVDTSHRQSALKELLQEK